MKRKLWLALLLAALLCVASALAEEPPLRMTFFQLAGFEEEEIGDSMLLQFPNGQTMLVDAFLPECGEALADALQAMGVEKLDALLLTHMHIDHIGGAAAIMDRFPIDALYGMGESYDSNTYRTYVQAAAAHQLREQPLRAGDALTFGDVTLSILSPDIDEEAHERFQDNRVSVADTNQFSIVFRLTYGDFRALFTGDIYQVTEKRLVKTYGDDLACDLLKIPHHGNDTSSGASFLKAVAPRVAVGVGNTEPPEWVLRRYEKQQIETHFTLWDGTVTVSAYPSGDMTLTCAEP